MPKFLVIFNPAARGEKSQRLRAFLQAQAGPNVTLAPTNGPHDATRLAAEGLRTGHEIIVAAGGDGTINEVVNGMSAGTLGVLPLGTVNVFARELGIPLRLEAAWALLAEGHPRVVDLGVAGSRRFVQLAGVGFDATAVRMTSWELKKKLGPLAYVVAGIRTLRGPLPVIEVVVDGQVRARGAAVLIGNGQRYGGSFRLFPQARLDDGRLDVCVFGQVTLARVLRYGWGVLRAAHVRQAGVQYFQAAAFECRANVPLELDGEDAGDAPVRFSVLPDALRVITPPRSGSSL
jgi:YegS/Rv2252/BmrU family lipid kinase